MTSSCRQSRELWEFISGFLRMRWIYGMSNLKYAEVLCVYDPAVSFVLYRNHHSSDVGRCISTDHYFLRRGVDISCRISNFLTSWLDPKRLSTKSHSNWQVSIKPRRIIPHSLCPCSIDSTALWYPISTYRMMHSTVTNRWQFAGVDGSSPYLHTRPSES